MSDLKQLRHQHLDMNRIAPLNCNRLVTFMNHYIVNIIEQLNQLSALADTKLHALNNKINICNSNLVILEMKLNSISGLAPAIVGQKSQQEVVVNKNEVAGDVTTQSTINHDTDVEENVRSTEKKEQPISAQQQIKENKEEEGEEVKQGETIEEDKEEEDILAKYKKMLQLGIPLGAVQQKMMTEGVDPNLLKTSYTS